MAAPVLIPCLVKLRAEFNTLAPDRDKASDGWIGDTPHQQEVSDHNDDETGSVPIHDADKVHEVHAVDVDNDLNVPGLNMEMVVQYILARCRAGLETRLRYIIWNRRIWEASNQWKQRAYTGPSAHTEHAHMSASYDSAKEASTASWHLTDLLLEDDMPLTPADGKIVWSSDIIPNPKQRADAATNKETGAAFAVGDIWARVYDLRDAVAAQGKALTAAIQALALKDQVDEKALAAALVPGVVAGVLAALPTDADDISQEEVTAAVKAAFGEAFGDNPGA